MYGPMAQRQQTQSQPWVCGDESKRLQPLEESKGWAGEGAGGRTGEEGAGAGAGAGAGGGAGGRTGEGAGEGAGEEGQLRAAGEQGPCWQG